jgi:thioredoxin
MNRLLYIFTIVVLAVFSASANEAQHVDSKKFFSLIETGEGILLDVRTPQEYSRGHIEGATLISTNDREFVNKVSLLQKDKPIYVYCLTGSRSRMVANYLAKEGYGVYNLARGIMEWQRYNYPVVQSGAPIASSSKTYNGTEFQNLITTTDLVLIDFHAPWCGPCKKMSPIIEKLQKEYTGKAAIEKVDIEANKTLKDAYNLNSIPGLIIFVKGKEVWRHTGLISYEELKSVIKKHI